MAWILENLKQCPRCGNTARVLAIRTGNRYRLSCSWCAHISQTSTAVDIFFHRWGEISDTILLLEGTTHLYKGKKYKYDKISVVNNGDTALVAKTSS